MKKSKNVCLKGSFLVYGNDGGDWFCRFFALSDGNHLLHFSELWSGESFWVVRYSRAEYYLLCGDFYGRNCPTLERRIRITDFFPSWRMSKLSSAFKWGVML